MSIEQYRSKVKAGIWQAVAQSGVDLASVSAEQQNKLVDTITDQVLGVVDDLLDVMPEADDVSIQLEGDEQLIWKGKPFLSLVERYAVTSERIKVVKGFLSKDYENFELIRVQDIDVSQSVGERILDLGDIRIVGADPTHPEIVLRNVKKPQEVYEMLRKAWLAARKKYGLIFREEM